MALLPSGLSRTPGTAEPNGPEHHEEIHDRPTSPSKAADASELDEIEAMETVPGFMDEPPPEPELQGLDIPNDDKQQSPQEEVPSPSTAAPHTPVPPQPSCPDCPEEVSEPPADMRDPRGGECPKRKGDRGDETEQQFRTQSLPPAVLSDKAIKQRMRRVFTKRKDGSMVLGERWNNMWIDASAGGGREQLLSMFEKCGYTGERGQLKNMPT